MATYHFGIRQNKVYPGGRCWIYWPKGLGSYPGYDFSIPTLRDGWRWSLPSEIVGFYNWTRQWAWELYVSPDEEPGTYSIATGATGENVDVTVIAAPAVRPMRYVNTANWSSIQGWLNDGYDVTLTSRTYFTNGLALTIPDGAKIVAYGATIVHSANALVQNALFEPEGIFYLHGGTLTHDDTIDEQYYNVGVQCRYIRKFPAPDGYLDIKHVTVLRGGLFADWGENVGDTSGGSVIEECVFRGGILGSQPYNCYLTKCIWDGYGINTELHSYFNSSGHKSLLTRSVMRNLGRGLIFQGRIFANMVIGWKFDNIRPGVINAGEVILLEDGAPGALPATDPSTEDCTFLDIKMTNCSGPGFTPQGDFMKGLIFIHGDIQTECDPIAILGTNDPGGIGGGMYDGFDFQNIQMRSRNGIVLTGGYGSHTWTNVNVIEDAGGRGNQGPYNDIYNIHKNKGPIYENTMGFTVGSYTQTFTTCEYITPNGVFPITSSNFNRVVTVDDTQVNLATITLNDDSVYFIELKVLVIEIAGSDKGNHAVYNKWCLATRSAGAGVVINDQDNYALPSTNEVTWNAFFEASGNTVYLAVINDPDNNCIAKIVEQNVFDLNINS